MTQLLSITWETLPLWVRLPLEACSWFRELFMLQQLKVGDVLSRDLIMHTCLSSQVTFWQHRLSYCAVQCGHFLFHRLWLWSSLPSFCMEHPWALSSWDPSLKDCLKLSPRDSLMTLRPQLPCLLCISLRVLLGEFPWQVWERIDIFTHRAWHFHYKQSCRRSFNGRLPHGSLGLFKGFHCHLCHATCYGKSINMKRIDFLCIVRSLRWKSWMACLMITGSGCMTVHVYITVY